MFGTLGFWEIGLIFIVILLLFGAKRLPEMAQGLGKGIREFRKAVKDTTEEIKGSVNTGEDKSNRSRNQQISQPPPQQPQEPAGNEPKKENS